MIFDSCGLPVWVPGPPWSHPWVLDVANLGQFSKLTKLKQLKLGKHKFKLFAVCEQPHDKSTRTYSADSSIY